MQITGKVHRIEQPTSRDHNGKTYREQKVVIEVAEGQYTQYIGCSIKRDNLIGTLQVGHTVTADINLRGVEYTNKQNQQANFTTIEIWRTSVGDAAPQHSTNSIASNRNEPPAHNPLANGPVDSLPF
jgi:hypothetical protein